MKVKVNQKEWEALLDAIPLIAVYVAYADGEIDHKETEMAKRVAKLRRFDSKAEAVIREYYDEVFENFDRRFKEIAADTSSDRQERNRMLEEEIESLNPILDKIDPLHAVQLLKSFRSFAMHVAKAEGGLFSMGAYGPKQAEAIKLKMLKDRESI